MKENMKQVLYVMLLSILVWHCKNNDKSNPNPPKNESTQKTASIESKIEIETLLNRFEKEIVHIKFDFEVGKEKTYSDVNTKKIFSSLMEEFQIDSSKYDVTFYCKDGYSPTISLIQLLEGNGFIVVKDINAKDSWDEEIKSRFSPAYLVWDISVNDHKHSFPYGIVQLQFVEKSIEYLLAKPNTNSKEVMEGFSIFKEKCIKCHSINQEGGALGSELNYPKNITEYWQIEQLKRFIKNPSSFRLNSKMPPMVELNNDQIDLVVEYLQFMTNQKINKK